MQRLNVDGQAFPGKSRAPPATPHLAVLGFLLGDISQTAGGATWLMYDVLLSPTSHVSQIGLQLAGSFQASDVVQVTLAPSSISNRDVGSAPVMERRVYRSPDIYPARLTGLVTLGRGPAIGDKGLGVAQVPFALLATGLFH
jgi:hypothetical protein